MTLLTTNTVKPTAIGKPQALRHVRAEDTKPKAFNFDAGQFKDAKPHASAFGRGPIHTSQLREMAENKARLAASAAKKAARAAAALAAATVPAQKKARKTRKGK
jgi:hypothetical protein